IAFSTTGTGEPTQTVQAPVIPMTLKEYGAFLELSVPGLKARPVYPGDESQEPFLPTGATFSEHTAGDDEASGPPDLAVAQFRKLEKTEGATKYLLRHADKPFQAVRFGQRGTVEGGSPQDEYTPGPGAVSSAGTAVTGTNTLFNYFFDPGDQIAVGTQVRVV